MPGHAVVDHRPRALEISAFTESDREDLLPHFAVLSYCTTKPILIIVAGDHGYIKGEIMKLFDMSNLNT